MNNIKKIYANILKYSKKLWRRFRDNKKTSEARKRLRYIHDIRLENYRSDDLNLSENFRSFCVRANGSALALVVAASFSFIPYTLINDCRSNVNASGALSLLGFLAPFWIVGFFVGLFPKFIISLYTYARDFCAIRSAKSKMRNSTEKLNNRINKLIRDRVNNAMAGTFSFIFFFIGVILLVFIFYGYKLYSWESIQEWQIGATEACVKAQRRELPQGWVNPWMNVTPVDPNSTNPLPPGDQGL